MHQSIPSLTIPPPPGNDFDKIFRSSRGHSYKCQIIIEMLSVLCISQFKPDHPPPRATILIKFSGHPKVIFTNARSSLKCRVSYASVNSKPDHPPPPRATPSDSHILVAPRVGFSLFCLARGFARGFLNQSKCSIILKKVRFLLCLLNK